MKKILFIVILACIFTAHLSYGQQTHNYMRNQNEGRIGIGTTLKPDLETMFVAIWFTNNFMVLPEVGFRFLAAKEMDAYMGISSRHYVYLDDISLYFGFRVGSMLRIPFDVPSGERSNQTDLFGGVTFGGEYFLSRNISAGIELQGDYVKSDERSTRFDNPGGQGFIFRPAILIIFYF